MKVTLLIPTLNEIGGMREIFKELNLDKEVSYALEEKLFHTKVGVEPLLSVRAAKKVKLC